jgi:hypothetical protein
LKQQFQSTKEENSKKRKVLTFLEIRLIVQIFFSFFQFLRIIPSLRFLIFESSEDKCGKELTPPVLLVFEFGNHFVSRCIDVDLNIVWKLCQWSSVVEFFCFNYFVLNSLLLKKIFLPSIKLEKIL